MAAINGEKLTEWDWRDTVMVPRKGSVTLPLSLSRFHRGFVAHCHMMNHEELGVMHVIEVYAS